MANVTVTLEGSQTVATGSSLLFKVTVTNPPNEPYLLTLWAEGRGQFLRNSFAPNRRHRGCSDPPLAGDWSRFSFI